MAQESKFFIKIGNLVLGGDSQYQISPPVSGLDSPAIRVGDGLYAGWDRGFVSGHFYGHRTITIKGFYIGRDCDHAADLRRVLFSYMRLRYALPILINLQNGDCYYTEGYVTDVKSDIEKLNAGEFQIVLLCPNPILYTADVETEKPIVKTYESTIPANLTVLNSGGVVSFPIITITGQVQGVEVSNTTVEQTMQINIETTSEDELKIDMEKRIITLNGSGANKYRSILSDWWSLTQEDNTIVVTSGGGGSANIKIEYREGWSGV